MDATTLQLATGCSAQRAAQYAGPLTDGMIEFAINTPARQAAFLATIGHESENFVYSREIWGPTAQQRRYEGRVDLGNTQKGDGELFKGRGLIQITGRYGYVEVSNALHVDFVNKPEALEGTDMAALSACWWWNKHGCNELADANDFRAITKTVNGGMNGYTVRIVRWELAKQVLGA